MPIIHIHVAEGVLTREQKRDVVERTTQAAVEAEGVPVTDKTWVLIHEIANGGWGEKGQVIEGGRPLPLIDIHTAVGWLTMARKARLIEDVARVVTTSAGVPAVAYVLVHEVADGGWGWKGRQLTRAVYRPGRFALQLARWFHIVDRR
jgi:4-oxalocrotonate tautomerase